MSGLYQLPGLFLTVLCHVIVIYHMAEHRYSGKKFVLYSCIFAVVFFIHALFQRTVFRKNVFYLSLISVCFLFWTIY